MRIRARNEKGAFQLSMGFIIAVVFAIVLLSLTLAWVRGLFGGVSSLTEDLTQQAQSNLRDAFRETGSNFAVWPTQYALDRGAGVKLSSGIENDARDGLTHYFKINVLPSAVSNNVLTSSGCTSLEACPSLQQTIPTWVTVDPAAKPGVIGQTLFSPVDITVPGNAISGTYIFSVYACFDGSSSSPSAGQVPVTCDATVPAENVWANPVQLVITVR
jgi:hypothetical protein